MSLNIAKLQAADRETRQKIAAARKKVPVASPVAQPPPVPTPSAQTNPAQPLHSHPLHRHLLESAPRQFPDHPRSCANSVRCVGQTAQSQHLAIVGSAAPVWLSVPSSAWRH
jgi:hypothetical protein